MEIFYSVSEGDLQLLLGIEIEIGLMFFPSVRDFFRYMWS